MVQYSMDGTVQYSTVQYGMVQLFSTVYYRTYIVLLYCAVLDWTVYYCTYSMLLYILCTTVLYCVGKTGPAGSAD